MNIMPQYDLANSRLQLGTGSRVQNLKVTPELCREWLGYVAPMLADTAQVDGDVGLAICTVKVASRLPYVCFSLP